LERCGCPCAHRFRKEIIRGCRKVAVRQCKPSGASVTGLDFGYRAGVANVVLSDWGEQTNWTMILIARTICRSSAAASFDLFGPLAAILRGLAKEALA